MVLLADARKRWMQAVAPHSGLSGEDAHLLDEAVRFAFGPRRDGPLQWRHLPRSRPCQPHARAAARQRARVARSHAASGARAHWRGGRQRAARALLLGALEAMAETGELREELLPLLWGAAGFKPDEHAVVLTTLAAAGVIFLAAHNASGRRWIVPVPAAARAQLRAAVRGGLGRRRAAASPRAAHPRIPPRRRHPTQHRYQADRRLRRLWPVRALLAARRPAADERVRRRRPSPGRGASRAADEGHARAGRAAAGGARPEGLLGAA